MVYIETNYFTPHTAQISSLDVGKDERVLRSEQKIITTSIAEIPSRKRTPLTKEQIEERKRKVTFNSYDI